MFKLYTDESMNSIKGDFLGKLMMDYSHGTEIGGSELTFALKKGENRIGSRDGLAIQLNKESNNFKQENAS